MPTVVLALVVGAAPVLSGATGFGIAVVGSARSGEVLTRCEPASADQEDAREAWKALREQIAALGPGSDPEAALASLRALLNLRCFELAAEHGKPPIPRHALSLRTWWEDGGYYWLWNFVEPVELGSSDDLRRVAVLPPSPRSVLSVETITDPRLAPLLCSVSDEECGLETLGWTERAQTALAPRPPARTWYDRDPPPAPLWERCEARAADADPDAIYTLWRRCLSEEREPERALPLGRTRAPVDGWLVIAGRRGHYEFCDVVRAYDLATGAAFLSDSCSALSLRSNGEVDLGRTDARRREELRFGRVLVENLREAAWMMFLERHVESVHVDAETYPIPRGATVRFDPRLDPDDGTRVSGGIGWNTSMTSLNWRWLRGGSTQSSGTLTWPEGYDPGEAHAARLLDIAERSFVAGCPPASPPAAPRPATPGLSDRDADPAAFDRTLGRLAAALRAADLESACREVSR